MLYTPENTGLIGRTVIKVVDATGTEILSKDHDWITCDTDSGKVTCFAKDEQGNYILSEDGKEIKRRTEQYLPPLSVIFKDTK